MRVEGDPREIIIQAETVVINAETEYMKDLVDHYNGLINEERPLEAENVLSEIMKESDRLHPKKGKR